LTRLLTWQEAVLDAACEYVYSVFEAGNTMRDEARVSTSVRYKTPKVDIFFEDPRWTGVPIGSCALRSDRRGTSLTLSLDAD
jgi:hypothetical protein